MVVAGAEYRLPHGWEIGLSGSLRDGEDESLDEPVDSVFARTDLYIRYDFLREQAVNPFIAAGASAAWLTTSHCEYVDTYQPECIDEDFGSFGISYRVGVALRVSSRQKLNISYSRYTDNDEVVIHTLSLGAQF
jgi:hypothetical protein